MPQHCGLRCQIHSTAYGCNVTDIEVRWQQACLCSLTRFELEAARTKQGNGNRKSPPHATRVPPCPDAGSGRELHLREEKVALLLHFGPRDALQHVHTTTVSRVKRSTHMRIFWRISDPFRTCMLTDTP